MDGGPLRNLRVVELGHVIAGPLAATLLADFGADVIKIEHPRSGDMLRDLGPKTVDGVGAWWKTLGRNKRLLALDWKAPEGREILKNLVQRSHVLIENFRPGVMERAGLAPAVLHEWNRDLVILRVSGYGQEGPLSESPAFGRAAEAMSGLAHLTGYADGPPMHPGFPAADSTTGLMGAFGIMMALHAIKDGVAPGQVVDLAVFEPLLRLIDYHVPVYTGSGRSPKRNGIKQPLNFAPGGMFQAKDGAWVTISAGSAETARRLLRTAGGGAWADEPRFSTMEGIMSHIDEIADVLESYIAVRTYDEVAEEFRRNDAVAARVLSVEEIVEHPQIAHRGDIIELEHEETRVVAPIPHMARTPGAVRWLGKAEIGADSLSILREAGCSDEEINNLAKRGLVGLGGAELEQDG